MGQYYTSNSCPYDAKFGAVRWRLHVSSRVLQPPHKFENFIVVISTLGQVGGFAQKPFQSSLVKICQCLGVTQ